MSLSIHPAVSYTAFSSLPRSASPLFWPPASLPAPSLYNPLGDAQPGLLLLAWAASSQCGRHGRLVRLACSVRLNPLRPRCMSCLIRPVLCVRVRVCAVPQRPGLVLFETSPVLFGFCCGGAAQCCAARENWWRIGGLHVNNGERVAEEGGRKRKGEPGPCGPCGPCAPCAPCGPQTAGLVRPSFIHNAFNADVKCQMRLREGKGRGSFPATEWVLVGRPSGSRAFTGPLSLYRTAAFVWSGLYLGAECPSITNCTRS